MHGCRERIKMLFRLFQLLPVIRNFFCFMVDGIVKNMRMPPNHLAANGCSNIQIRKGAVLCRNAAVEDNL